MCIGISTVSVYADTVVGYFLADTATGHINYSGSGNVSLSASANKFGYIVMPDTSVSHSNSVSVTFRKGLDIRNYSLTADGQYHEITLSSGYQLAKGTWTVSWSGATNIYYISISFGKS